MYQTISRWFGSLVVVVVLAACGAATANPTTPTDPAMIEKPTDSAMMAEPTSGAMMTEPTDGAMMEKPTDGAMMEKPTSGAMMEKPTDTAMMEEKPAWQTVALTDARTGKQFTLADFAGKTVYVEPMATWCTNCRAQLENVSKAKAQLASDDYVFIGLSVETDLPVADLASYSEKRGFDWSFAVLSTEALTQLTDEFGRTVTNPPSTPHFIIAPDGTVSKLMTGIESTDEIMTQLQQAHGS